MYLGSAISFVEWTCERVWVILVEAFSRSLICKSTYANYSTIVEMKTLIFRRFLFYTKINKLYKISYILSLAIISLNGFNDANVSYVLSFFWLVVLFDLFQGATFGLLHIEVEEDDAKESKDTVEQKHSPQAQTGLQAEECLGGEEPHDVGDRCCYATGETASSVTFITVCWQTVTFVMKIWIESNWCIGILYIHIIIII